MPVERWDTVLDGTQEGPRAHGFEFFGNAKSDEDCLHVNVFTKNVRKI